MAELATGWLTLVPSFQGGQKAIVKELGGVGAPAGKRAGAGFLGALKGTAVVAAGNLLAGGISRGINAAKGVITKVFSGGWDRMLNLQDARIMLGTIGAPVEASMKAVESGVDGTKFAISDAAGMAANLALALGNGSAASGEMERWIALTGDAAQFTGREFTDIQRIMQKVVADGRVTGDTFQEMPIAAAALAEHLGITQEEVRKLASQGKISSEEFAAAMEGSIGGAAKEAGGSIRSMLANFGTAVAATGANFLAPMEDSFLKLLGVSLDSIKSIRDAAKPLGEAFASWISPHIDSLADGIGKIPALIDGVSGGLSGLIGTLTGGLPGGGFIGTLFVSFQELMTILGPIAGQFFEVVSAASPLSMIFQALQPVLPQIGALLMSVASTLGLLLAAVIPIVMQLSGALVPVLTSLVTALLPVFGQIIGVIAGLLPMLVPLLAMVAETVVSLVAAFAPLITQLISAILPIFGQLIASVLPLVVAALTAIIPAVLMVVDILAAVLIPIIQALLPVITTVFSAVSDIISGVMKVVTGVIQVALGIITGNWGKVWEGIKNVLSGIWDIIKGVVKGAIAVVQAVIASVLGVIVGIWNGMWTGISTFLSNTWSSIVNGVKSGIDGVTNFFSSLPGQIMGLLRTLPALLLTMGVDMISGLVKGIVRAGPQVLKTLTGIVKNAVDGVLGFLGIKSPSRLFMSIGEDTGEGMAIGLESSAGMVQDAANMMVPDVQPGTYMPTVGYGGTAASGSGQGLVVQGPLIQVDSLTVDSDERVKEISQELYRRAAAADRSMGKVKLGGAVE